MGMCSSKTAAAPPAQGKSKEIDFFAEFLGQPADYYEVGEQVGKGAFSVVRRATDKKTGEDVALKMIPNSILVNNYNQTKQEVEVLSKVGYHPNIVKMHRVIRDKRQLCIAMEFLQGGELYDRICELNRYDEQTTRIIARQLLEAISYLHQNGIAHRDLKPENVLLARPLDESEIKVTDFGFASVYNPAARFAATCGTPLYVAPEVINLIPYDTQCDMWSFGVLIYVLLCGYPPFYGDNDEQLFDSIKHADYEFHTPEWDPISSSAKDFLSKIFITNPAKRMTAKQALTHPWISDAPLTSRPHLANTVLELKRTQCKRKLIKGIEAVIAMNRLQRAIQAEN